MHIRFLIPINFEPYTVNAINYCIMLAHKLEGEITLFHAYTPFLNEDTEEVKQDTQLISSPEKALERLNQIKEETLNNAKFKEVVIKTKVEQGYPEDVIPAFCNHYTPDLVVMGTKSKGETIKELLGSVTLDVIQNVNDPVLVVPKDYDLNLNRLHNVLFLTDFDKCEYSSLHKLVRLIMSFNIVIHNVQYCPGGKEKANMNKLAEYTEYCSTTYRNQEMKANYIFGSDIVDAANKYIEQTNIDLLAITSKKRNIISKILHPSLTKRILFNIDIPMLFFHQ